MPIDEPGRRRKRSLLEAIFDLMTRYRTGKQRFPLPWHQKVNYFDIGLKGGWADTLVLASYGLLSVGVMQRIIPIFGSAAPTFFDQLFSLLMALSYTLGATLLMAFHLGRHGGGKMQRHAMRQIYAGFVTGCLIKTMAIFCLFHLLYWHVTPEILSHAQDRFAVFTFEKWNMVLSFYVAMRNVLMQAGVVVVVSTWVCVTIPLISVLLYLKRTQEGETR